jgi:hypothetical protein
MGPGFGQEVGRAMVRVLMIGAALVLLVGFGLGALIF